MFSVQFKRSARSKRSMSVLEPLAGIFFSLQTSQPVGAQELKVLFCSAAWWAGGPHSVRQSGCGPGIINCGLVWAKKFISPNVYMF